MTARTCPTCARPMTDQATICHRCTNTLRKQLTELPWLAAQLEVTLTRRDQIGTRTEGRSAVTGVPFNEAASYAARVLTEILVAWAQLAHDDVGARPADDSTQALAYAIRDVLHDLRMHPAAADLAIEVAAVHSTATRVIDLPQDRSRVPVGPCPEDYPDETGTRAACPGHVVAHYPADDRPYLACNSCQSQWPPEQWPRVGRLMQARQASIADWPTATDLAAHLGLAIETIRNAAHANHWRRRRTGRITQYHPADISIWLDNRAKAS